MTLAIVVLLAVVALGRGGYAPWATLVLECGAAISIVWLGFVSLWERSETRTQRHRAWKKMPFHVRHPTVGRWLSFGKTPRADVEILLPGDDGDEPVELDVGRYAYPLGLAVKRTGLGLPLLLLTVWLVLSVVPLNLPLLESFSPEAHRYRVEASELLGSDVPRAASWSLTPFLTLRSLWMWLSVVAVFFVMSVTHRRARAAATLGLLLLVLGAGSGVLGMVDWVTGLPSLGGREPDSLRASGSFGNPNHFATFQAMLLVVSLGWLAYFRERHIAHRAHTRKRSDAWGLGSIAGLGILVLSLGLVLSLSRSGLTFSLVGCAAFVLLTRRTGAHRWVWALALVAAGFTVWIGIEPVLGRFESLEEEWFLERGRVQVWEDSAPAVSDYWLTGSGLSSFRYVAAVYRTFGGRIFFSWAHNDYLQLAIELGLPGMLLLIWIGVAVVRAARRTREALGNDVALLHLHSGFVAALVVAALHSFTDFSLHLPANLALLAVLVGVAVGLEPTAAANGARRF